MGDQKLSKLLAYVLRHGAQKMDLHYMEGGFLYVDDLLADHQFKPYSLQDIQNVVRTSDKKRFFMDQHPSNGRHRIRATQGHSPAVQVSAESLDMTPITHPRDAPIIVHGTVMANWQQIKITGLKRLRRTHIHFAIGEPGQSDVISGMSGRCDVVIFIHVEKALAGGITFFRSANNVILSPGDRDGTIHPRYFKEVLQRHTREILYP